MKRSWLIGVAVAIALAAFVGWIAKNTYWDEVSVPTLLRGEAAQNPFYAAQRLVEQLGATSEWRRTLGELPSTDDIMVLTHWHWDLIENRRRQLERWVESGGRIVIDGTLAGGTQALQEWSGLATDSPDYEDEYVEEDEGSESESEYEAPDPCRELLIVHGKSHTNPNRDTYSVCTLDLQQWLTSSRALQWALEDDAGLHAARVWIGLGSVTWINATPFGNRELLEVDHGVLFVDATSLDRDDHVVFVSEEERASLLELIWTYGSPAVVLCLFLIGLALWRNSMRFGPLQSPPDVARRSLAEQIRGTGQFVLRVGAGRGLHAAMVRALREAARSRVPNYERMEHADRIAAVARLAEVDAEALAEAINFGGSRRKHEFKNTVAVLNSARSRLIANADRLHVSGSRSSSVIGSVTDT